MDQLEFGAKVVEIFSKANRQDKERIGKWVDMWAERELKQNQANRLEALEDKLNNLYLKEKLG